MNERDRGNLATISRQGGNPAARDDRWVAMSGRRSAFSSGSAAHQKGEEMKQRRSWRCSEFHGRMEEEVFSQDGCWRNYRDPAARSALPETVVVTRPPAGMRPRDAGGPHAWKVEREARTPVQMGAGLPTAPWSGRHRSRRSMACERWAIPQCHQRLQALTLSSVRIGPVRRWWPPSSARPADLALRTVDGAGDRACCGRDTRSRWGGTVVTTPAPGTRSPLRSRSDNAAPPNRLQRPPAVKRRRPVDRRSSKCAQEHHAHRQRRLPHGYGHRRMVRDVEGRRVRDPLEGRCPTSRAARRLRMGCEFIGVGGISRNRARRGHVEARSGARVRCMACSSSAACCS